MTRWLQTGLATGQVILLDGPTGTQLQARGVPMHGSVWSGTAALDHPSVLLEVHRDYVRAGADVITANTFSCNRYLLEPAGLGHLVSSLNAGAVLLARRATEVDRDRPVAVAGSISGFMGRPDDPRWTAVEEVERCVAEQAGILAGAGVDLIILEMMEQVEYLLATYQAAAATGLPVWLGCSGRRVCDGPLRVFDYPDRDFGDLLDAAVATGAGVINVMHTSVPDTTEGLRMLQDRFGGVVGVYPNAGHFEMPDWRFSDEIPPPAFVAAARGWIQMGAQIVGGCCGLGPKHIRALRRQVPAVGS